MMDERQSGYGVYKRSFWDKMWRNDEGHVVLFQWPNVWLIAWAAFNFVAVVSPTRTFSAVTWWIGFGLLAIWSILEIFRGVNYFRRFLGILIFILDIFLVIRTIL